MKRRHTLGIILVSLFAIALAGPRMWVSVLGEAQSYRDCVTTMERMQVGDRWSDVFETPRDWNAMSSGDRSEVCHRFTGFMPDPEQDSLAGWALLLRLWLRQLTFTQTRFHFAIRADTITAISAEDCCPTELTGDNCHPRHLPR
jgi:hypothetical protein